MIVDHVVEGCAQGRVVVRVDTVVVIGWRICMCGEGE